MLFDADKKSACIPSSSLSRVYISEGKGLSNKLNRVNIFLNLSPVPPLSTNKDMNLLTRSLSLNRRTGTNN